MSIKITKIKESGSNNTLLWAIKNGAEIRSDSALEVIINNDLSYRVSITGVNMFELFRLIQTFRHEVNIVEEHGSGVPSMTDLAERFPGMFADPDDPDKTMPLAEVAENAITRFTNIVQQMYADTDIIGAGSAKLYIPMAARTYDIEIPIAFWDLANACTSDEEFNKIFNSIYPETLDQVCEDQNHQIIRMIKTTFVKLTSILRVDSRLEKYIDYTRYAPLSKLDNSGMYKLYLLGFERFSQINHSTISCSLFNVNAEVLTKKLKMMSRLDTPLILEFAVQMPIAMMMTLENIVGRDMLTVSGESSMISILDQGLIFNQSVTSEQPSEPDEGDTSFEDTVNAYRVRITEANQFALNTIKIITETGEGDQSAPFALLPSIYTTRATIKVKINDLLEIAKMCSANALSSIINDMIDTGNKIEADIRNSAN